METQNAPSSLEEIWFNKEYQEALELFDQGERVSQIKENYVKGLLGTLHVFDQAYIHAVYLNRKLLQLGEDLFRNPETRDKFNRLFGRALLRQIDGSHPEKEDFLGMATVVQDGLKLCVQEILKEVVFFRDSLNMSLEIPDFLSLKVIRQLDQIREQKISNARQIKKGKLGKDFFFVKQYMRDQVPMGRRPSRLYYIPLDPSFFKDVHMPHLDIEEIIKGLKLSPESEEALKETTKEILLQLETLSCSYEQLHTALKKLTGDLYNSYQYDTTKQKTVLIKEGGLEKIIAALAKQNSPHASLIRKRISNFETPLRNGVSCLGRHISFFKNLIQGKKNSLKKNKKEKERNALKKLQREIFNPMPQTKPRSRRTSRAKSI